MTARMADKEGWAMIHIVPGLPSPRNWPSHVGWAGLGWRHSRASTTDEAIIARCLEVAHGREWMRRRGEWMRMDAECAVVERNKTQRPLAVSPAPNRRASSAAIAGKMKQALVFINGLLLFYYPVICCCFVCFFFSFFSSVFCLVAPHSSHLDNSHHRQMTMR
jgi:hypothetical protein